MTKTEYIIKYLNECPGLSYSEIAHKLIQEVSGFENDNPNVLRKYVSFLRNDNIVETEFEPGMSEMPESWYEPPANFKFDGKIAVMNDIHIPFHDKHALKTAIDYISKYNPDYVLLNGDIGDFYATSRFIRDPQYRDAIKEISLINQFLDYLRSKFTNVIYKEGNHEVRLFDYIAMKVPEMGGLEAIKIENLLRLKERNIIFVSNRNRIHIDKLSIIHGNEIPAGGIINVARTKILRAMGNVLFGHHHVTQEFTQRTIDDKTIGAWAVGCLCGLSPDFSKFNSWNHGFALVETIEGGGFEVLNKRIINNQVM